MKHLAHHSHAGFLRLVAFAGLSFAAISSSHAAINVLHEFTGNTFNRFSGPATDGASPYSGVVLSGTKMYGVTKEGGASSIGTLYSMNTNGTGFSLLHSFAGGPSDGREPHGTIALAGSTLYGTTTGGGANNQGTIFKANTDGTGYSVLHNFASANGYYPNGSLLVSDTKLFGLTLYGGTSGNGTIFSMDTDGTDYTILHHFNVSPDGAYPYSSLTLSGSTLYGTVSQGGAFGKGGIFKIDADGTDYAMIHSFNVGTGGDSPTGRLTISGNTIYGTATVGGAANSGTIFSLQTDGSNFNLLHSFTGGPGGATPVGGVTLSGQKLYGMTFSGTLYSIDTDGTDFTVEETFTGFNGSSPYIGASLALSDDTAKLYGTTYGGGNAGVGVIFSTDIEPVPEPGTAFFGFALVGLAAGVRRRKTRV